MQAKEKVEAAKEVVNAKVKEAKRKVEDAQEKVKKWRGRKFCLRIFIFLKRIMWK